MKRNLLKLALFLLFLIAILSFFHLEYDQFLRLEVIQAKKAAFDQFYEEAPILTTGLFFTTYVLVATLSLPGATLLGLLSGSLFGFLTGSLLVSFASSIGATLAFLSSRFIFSDFVQKKMSHRIQLIQMDFNKSGRKYLLTLRLIPLFPYFIINLAMGLTTIKIKDFYLISQLGMLPGTMVYVNAGTQLTKIRSVDDVLSLPLIVSLTLLGLMPLLAKKLRKLLIKN